MGEIADYNIGQMERGKFHSGYQRTRSDHLQWCKDRAMEYVAEGDLSQAFASFASDMSKHPETKSHIGLDLGVELFFSCHLNTQDQMTHWIQGFN